jgi:conserved oligomeric Golgi complex subunit 4
LCQEDHPDAKIKIKPTEASPQARTLLDGIVSLNASESHTVFEGLTTQYYTTLEIWYVRTSIDKVMFLLSLVNTPPSSFL